MKPLIILSSGCLGAALVLAAQQTSPTAGALRPIGIFDSQGDVGVTPKTGSAEYNSMNGEYRITGGGANMWAAEDAFYFVWKRVTGDVTISLLEASFAERDHQRQSQVAYRSTAMK